MYLIFVFHKIKVILSTFFSLLLLKSTLLISCSVDFSCHIFVNSINILIIIISTSFDFVFHNKTLQNPLSLTTEGWYSLYLAPSAKLSSVKCSLADRVCTWEFSCSVLIGEPLTKHLIPALSYANSFSRIHNAVSLWFEISLRLDISPNNLLNVFRPFKISYLQAEMSFVFCFFQILQLLILEICCLLCTIKSSVYLMVAHSALSYLPEWWTVPHTYML